MCGGTQQASVYNPAGDVTKEVAHDGTVTFYAYDSIGRQTERATFPPGYQAALTRPALSLATRVVSTRWHATFNLPTQVAEPGKVTAYTYNAQGLLTSQSWSATADATGAAGFGAVKTGRTHSTEWGYSANSQNTSVVERVDGVETQRWTLAYDAAGDLSGITDVTGAQSATLTNDAFGRLTRLVASNGAFATFSANSRGQMVEANTPGGNVRYVYDARNLINEIRFGDGRWVRYRYNAAQKLIEIRDSSGLVEVIAGSEADGMDPQRLAQRVAQWLVDRGGRASQMLVPQAHAQPQVLLVPAAIVWGLLTTAETQRRSGGAMPGAVTACCGQSGSPNGTDNSTAPADSWLAKVGVMLSGQSQPASQSTAPTYDKAGLLVSPQSCMPPPGNCDPGKWRQMQDYVNERCKSEGRRCESGMARIDLTSRLDLNRMCAVARDRINKTCFAGGNKSHREAAINAWNAVTRCESFLLQAP